MTDTMQLVFHVAAAATAGGIVGANRDLYGKPSGVRVHALVALGSALITMAGTQLGAESGNADAVSRVIQGIVGGIGFLGAGVILRGEGGLHVYHVATAASIWVTAAIGIACGLGAWKLVAMAVVAVVAILVIGSKIDRALRGRFGPEGSDET